MTDLITKEEVITLAFQRPISTTKIPEGLINSIQVQHLKPALKKDFYNAVIAAPQTYDTLVDLIKPALAAFVKFYILPEIYNDISNSGINKIPGINRAAGTNEDLGSARQIALDQANLAMAAVTDYLNDNATNYPLYSPGGDPNNKVIIAGGIIFATDYTEDQE